MYPIVKARQHKKWRDSIVASTAGSDYSSTSSRPGSQPTSPIRSTVLSVGARFGQVRHPRTLNDELLNSLLAFMLLSS